MAKDHATMGSVGLNVLDELYLHLDRPDEPWTVHLEVEVARTIDVERLARATIAGAGSHPLARARLRQSRGTDVRYHWEIADALESAPLEAVPCASDGDRAAARERLMGSSPGSSSRRRSR